MRAMILDYMTQLAMSDRDECVKVPTSVILNLRRQNLGSKDVFTQEFLNAILKYHRDRGLVLFLLMRQPEQEKVTNETLKFLMKNLESRNVKIRAAATRIFEQRMLDGITI